MALLQLTHTLGDNPCIPSLLGNYFGWKYDEKGVWVNDTWVSLPHFSYGATEIDLSHLKSIRKWQIRSLIQLSEYIYTDKVLSVLPLEEDAEVQFAGFTSNLRRKIRKSIKSGIKIQKGRVELLDDFYKVYFRNTHRLGSPVLAKSFFQNIVTHYTGGEAEIFCAYFNRKVVGAGILLTHRDFAENTWFATLRSMDKYYISSLLHWEMIHYSIRQKCRFYSFGRSTCNSGVHRFKQQWHTQDIPLYWNYSHSPKLNIRKVQMLKTLWKLLPLPIARFIGPFFAKRIY